MLPHDPELCKYAYCPIHDEERRQVTAPAAATTDDLLHEAWGVIANAANGDWSQETEEWQAAARRWRDRYHTRLDADRVAADPAA